MRSALAALAALGFAAVLVRRQHAYEDYLTSRVVDVIDYRDEAMVGEMRTWQAQLVRELTEALSHA